MDKTEKAGIAIIGLAIAAFIIYYLYKNSALGKISTGLSKFLSGLNGIGNAGTQIQQDATAMYNDLAGIGSQASKDMSKGMNAISSGWKAASSTVQTDFGKVQQGFTSLSRAASQEAMAVQNKFASGANFVHNIVPLPFTFAPLA